MKCEEMYGCGEECNALFTMTVKDWNNEAADDEGLLDVKVCRDCAAHGDWEDS